MMIEPKDLYMPPKYSTISEIYSDVQIISFLWKTN